MIIGKSLTALGGGGLKPEIHVTAKAGALLNLHYKDSSIILQSYQLGADETQHTFIVNVSETAYVVEDVTNGKSVEVLVDAVAQYNIEIDYKLWLYKDGDECTNVTGDWSSYPYRYGSYNVGKSPSITKNDTNIYAELSGNNTGYRGVVMTNQSLDLTGYEYLKIHVIAASTYTDSDGMKKESGAYICSTKTKGDGYIATASATIITLNNESLSDKTISVDIFGINEDSYISIGFLVGGLYSSSTSYSKLRFDKIWLE